MVSEYVVCREIEEHKLDEGAIYSESSLPVTTLTMSAEKAQMKLPVSSKTTLIGSSTCPCCNQTFDGKETLNEPTICVAPPQAVASQRLEATGEFQEQETPHLHTPLSTSPVSGMHEYDKDVQPGILAQGLYYYPTRILAEGWLHKKGTGNDWLSSRGWKTRWTRLCLARVDGFDTEVPLLLIYWFPSSEDPSTVIVLDHTVVLKFDKEDKSLWNSFRFEIRHVSKEGNETRASRTFAAPRKYRDCWVYAISDALLSYEKEKHQARKQRLAASSPFRVEHNRSPVMDDIWMGDRMLVSPPASPIPTFKRLPSPACSPRLPRPIAKSPKPNLSIDPAAQSSH